MQHVHDLETVSLDRAQEQFLFEIAQPYITKGTWPTWYYVQEIHARRGQDADAILASLPYTGGHGAGILSYGFTTRIGQLRPDETIGLTVAAALPLEELRPLVAEPFLRVLHHMIDVQSSIVPEPGGITQAILTDRNLAAALPGLSQSFIDRLPDLLDREPGTRSVGAAGAGRGPEGWRRGVTSTVYQFRNAKDLDGYVATTCALVRKWHNEQIGTPAPLVGSQAIPAPTEEPQPAPYINQDILDELEAAGAKSQWKVDKLLDLLGELNSNHADHHPYACLALIRAVMDHVPSIFGQKGYAGIISSVKMGDTDKKYLTALAGYRFPGDDVMHRQASKTPTRIDMTDVPPALYVKALLNQVLIALKTTP
ncbi:hypothetical protein [Streptomyces sp. NPDC058084]|uniref:hypothetical protein n=1 Tax=Streptomyces sp. NPDC058084 TaxID=3346333 RepID=UPI0036E3D8E8